MSFLAGDIGGTKTLLALYENQGKGFVELRREKFNSHNHETFSEIVERFLVGEQEPPQKACFGIAGPVKNGVCHTTNLPWEIDAHKLSEKFSIPQVSLLNDLEANAYGLKTLKKKDFYTLNQGEPILEANQGLISAGTGLGEAPIFFVDGKHIPSPSEGGHVDFAPRNELELELIRYLWEKFGHASYERVLSGQGLVNLYHFLLEVKHNRREKVVVEAMQKEDPAKVISRLGLLGECQVCQQALKWFCDLYGAEAGNFALKSYARGGVYIGGGIAPKILPELKKGEFMKSFMAKGRFSDFLSLVPVYVVLEEETALKGAAFYARSH